MSEESEIDHELNGSEEDNLSDADFELTDSGEEDMNGNNDSEAGGETDSCDGKGEPVFASWERQTLWSRTRTKS